MCYPGTDYYRRKMAELDLKIRLACFSCTEHDFGLAKQWTKVIFLANLHSLILRNNKAACVNYK